MRKLVFLSIFIMFCFSVTELHAAAKEKANAKNFDPKLIASLQKLLDPNRFYPDLKNDPDTFVELPEMAGPWAGLVAGGLSHFYITSPNTTLASKFSLEDDAVFLYARVVPSAGTTTYERSQAFLQGGETAPIFYSVDFSATYGDKRVNHRTETGPVLSQLYPEWRWWVDLPGEYVNRYYQTIYDFYEVSEGKTKWCETVIVTAYYDDRFGVEGIDCTYLNQ